MTRGSAKYWQNPLSSVLKLGDSAKKPANMRFDPANVQRQLVAAGKPQGAGLLALVRPGNDLVLQRIPKLKCCKEPRACTISTPQFAAWQFAPWLPLFVQGELKKRLQLAAAGTLAQPGAAADAGRLRSAGSALRPCDGVPRGARLFSRSLPFSKMLIRSAAAAQDDFRRPSAACRHGFWRSPPHGWTRALPALRLL